MEYRNLNHVTEADNLLIFMNHIPPIKKTTLFKPPADFNTIVKDREKDENHWEEILEEIFNKKAIETKYCSRIVFYFQFRPPHASHFMGRNYKDQYIITSTKKDLFSGKGA
jgi:hypothetical protein